MEKLAGLLPAPTRWRIFLLRRAANAHYPKDGDVVTASIADPDGAIDLGSQRNVVVGETS